MNMAARLASKARSLGEPVLCDEQIAQFMDAAASSGGSWRAGAVEVSRTIRVALKNVAADMAAGCLSPVHQRTSYPRSTGSVASTATPHYTSSAAGDAAATLSCELWSAAEMARRRSCQIPAQRSTRSPQAEEEAAEEPVDVAFALQSAPEDAFSPLHHQRESPPPPPPPAPAQGPALVSQRSMRQSSSSLGNSTTSADPWGGSDALSWPEAGVVAPHHTPLFGREAGIAEARPAAGPRDQGWGF